MLVLYWTLMKLVPGHGACVLLQRATWQATSTGASFLVRFAAMNGGDNEEILSTMPAISTVLFGVLTGH